MTGITAKRHLNPVRKDRTYPRVVKRARHNSYRVKRRTDHGTPPRPPRDHQTRQRATAGTRRVTVHPEPSPPMINLR